MNEMPSKSDFSNDLTGSTLGGFSIIRRLGRGGMADVYLARQESLQRNVALKILKPELARDHSYIERFQREAQSAARLVQANIVQVYEVGQIDGYHYIAQEYVVGRNLREYLTRYGAVKPIMAVNVLRQVALALQKADEFNVIHRDIKPENIMLSPNGEVKVADFGLARINDDVDRNHLTQVGVTMGTPLYMSPEQFDGQPVDIRSDIYSLGVTAYHMLAGKPPFDGDNALAIAVKHVNTNPEPLSDIRPDIPTALIALIERMMAKKTIDRPQQVVELLKAIKTIKVSGDEDWEHLVETLAMQPTRPKGERVTQESQLAATQQLQSIMRGQVPSWWTQPSTLLTLGLAILASAIAGYGLSVQFPAVDPLRIVEADHNLIPSFNSAQEQYEWAVNSHPYDLEYYQAVLDYFPLDSAAGNFNQTSLYRNRAKERMAEIHLIHNDFEQAAAIYREFAQFDPQSRFHIVGQAGLAVVYHRQNQRESAKKQIVRIESQINGALNSFLTRTFTEVRNFYFPNNLDDS